LIPLAFLSGNSSQARELSLLSLFCLPAYPAGAIFSKPQKNVFLGNVLHEHCCFARPGVSLAMQRNPGVILAITFKEERKTQADPFI
jgi:hypothetical protein